MSKENATPQSPSAFEHSIAPPTSPRKPFVKKIAAESPALFRGLFKASANDDADDPSDDMLLAMSGAMAKELSVALKAKASAETRAAELAARGEAKDRALRQAQALLREAAYEVLGPEGDPLPPIVDFDVLFVPDAADKIALIAPGLAFHEINDVGLLGPSDWLDDELLRVARRHVSGAVISSPFHAESDLPFVADFVDGYRKTFAAEPDMYAAEAFDATNLVLVQLSSGRDDREGVREGLLGMRAYPGAAGVLTMHPNGNARRRPFLLRVTGRRFQPLD